MKSEKLRWEICSRCPFWVWAVIVAVIFSLVGFPLFYNVKESVYACFVGDFQLSISIATMVVACLAAKWTKSQFMYEKRVKRIELFNVLCQIYEFDNVVDWKNEGNIKKALSKITQIAAAINLDLIDESERAYFESRINSFLKKADVITVLGLLHQNDAVGEFSALLKYVDERPHVFDSDDDVCPSGGVEENVGSGCSEEIKNQREIQSSELTNAHCMVVRVNRQYRAGMTSEEIYEIARGYWRINEEKASRVKYAVVVANGIVKEVFDVKSWEGVVGNEFSKRKRFVGKVACASIRNTFLGGSVRGLFKHGDQYPIRYFGVD